MNKERLKEILQKQWELALQRLTKGAVPRSLTIDNELENPEVTIISGVRRCGKSLYLTQLKKKYEKEFASLLVEFDDPALLDFEGSDFTHLLDICTELNPHASRKLLLLDEIQNVKEWEKWIPHLAKDRSVKIVVTGSNATLLSSELATLLTGRHRTYEMTPLSYQEILGSLTATNRASNVLDSDLLSAYDRYFKFGGFPRSFVDQDASILPQYFTDIIERDVIARHGARLTRPLKELSRILCSDNTRLINRSRMAKTLGIKDNGTIQRYTRWLEDCYLFNEIKGFSPSVKKQIRSNPKFYSVDPTLARMSAFSLMGGEGAFLENIVYLELRRRGYEIHYWKAESDEAEVDFIARKAGHATIGVQVSLTVIDEKTLQRELTGLGLLKKELGITDLMLITKMDPQREIMSNGAHVPIVPFTVWGRGES
jgi:predicted AAA+ superfamily ATPase